MASELPMGNEKQRNLVLVGMMGSGKTEVGRRCAERLALPFLDTDDLVEATDGRAVREIFALEGETAFRAMERAAVQDAAASPAPAVISCGGGAVLDPANRRALRKKGFVVWLRASPGELARRVEAVGLTERPLLSSVAASGGASGSASGNQLADTIQRLAAIREEAYGAAAHVAVETEGCSPDEVADRVMALFAKQSVPTP